jgi:hypothetical protein
LKWQQAKSTCSEENTTLLDQTDNDDSKYIKKIVRRSSGIWIELKKNATKFSSEVSANDFRGDKLNVSRKDINCPYYIGTSKEIAFENCTKKNHPICIKTGMIDNLHDRLILIRANPDQKTPNFGKELFKVANFQRFVENVIENYCDFTKFPCYCVTCIFQTNFGLLLLNLKDSFVEQISFDYRSKISTV